MWRASACLVLALLSACGDLPPPGIAAIPSRDDPRCLVTDVVDGDTVKIDCGGGPVSARLVGFDTPETFRPGCAAEAALGARATDYLTQQLRSATRIGFDVQGRDKYQRALVAMTLDGVALSDMMISQGLAVRYAGGRRINWCDRLT